MGCPQQRIIPVPVDNPLKTSPPCGSTSGPSATSAVRPTSPCGQVAPRTPSTLRPEDNHLFRALHDAYPVELNSGFDLAGELRVSLTMYEDLRLRGMHGATALVYLIDTIGQSLMHFLEGDYVPDQLAFATAVWDRMLPKMRGEPSRVSILPLLQETVRNLSKEQA